MCKSEMSAYGLWFEQGIVAPDFFHRTRRNMMANKDRNKKFTKDDNIANII